MTAPPDGLVISTDHTRSGVQTLSFGIGTVIVFVVSFGKNVSVPDVYGPLGR